MAISNKFFNFNKYPHLGGLKGKSTGGSAPASRSWTVYDTCGSTNPSTIYTGADDPIDIGTIIYSNEALTNPLGSSIFYKDLVKYTVDITSTISVKAPCFNIWSLYNDCNGALISAFTAYVDSTLAVGTRLWNNSALSDPFVNYSSGLPYIANSSNYRYYTTYVSGSHTYINSIIGCPISVELYSGCASGSSSTYYVPFNQMEAGNININDGAKVFSDTTYSDEFPHDGTFVYNTYNYYYSRTTGTAKLGACST